MADYIREHGNDIEEITDDFLKRKGHPRLLGLIQQPRHWGDELAVSLLARMGNRAICVVMKTGYWSTFKGVGWGGGHFISLSWMINFL